ncbi:MAG: V-type ATPase subunit [Anaerolineaceae bacterium]|nr:V-type ATPase subunit [Anaerolineaceae bacterium]
MSNVSAYGLVNVHVRTAIGELLSPETWSKLSRSNDFQTFLQNLSDTAYGSITLAIPAENQNPRFFAYAIRKRIPEKFQVVEKSAPSSAKELFRRIFLFYDLNNLKVILRGIRAADSWDKLRYLLAPMGSFASLPYQAMAGQGSVEGAIELTKGTHFYKSLSHAVQRFSQEDSLFPIELLLDLDYWQMVWESVQNLKGEDKKDAAVIIGQILDKYNLIWAGRYFLFHHLQEAEIINYTMGFAPRVQDRQIRQIAGGTDVSELAESLYPELKGKVDSNLSDADKLARWEVELDRHFARRCRQFFVGNPFHLGPSLAYLFLLEYEIRDLTLLAEAKTLNVPRERYMPFLINEIKA